MNSIVLEGDAKNNTSTSAVIAPSSSSLSKMDPSVTPTRAMPSNGPATTSGPSTSGFTGIATSDAHERRVGNVFGWIMLGMGLILC